MSFEKIIYLDNNATTRCDPKVVEAMLPYFEDLYGNESSPHVLGRQAAKAVASARENIAESIDCNESAIYFTGCATEANNIVIFGLAQADNRRRKILVSEIEHKSVLGPCSALAAKGYEVTLLPIEANGVVDLDAAKSLIDDNTLMVTVQGANNEIGTLQPVSALADIAHEHGAVFHCDATQMLGKVAVSFAEMGADYMSFSAHKAYGPKGIGFIVARNQVRGSALSPIMFGGGQERGLRPGTLNIPGIVGTGEACRLCKSYLAEETERITSLRKFMEENLQKNIPKCKVTASHSFCLPGTLSIIFPGIPADLLITRCPTICMSMGSACSSGTVDPSHVLLAMGMSRDQAKCTVRISIGRYNTLDHIRAAVVAITAGVNDLMADSEINIKGNT